MGTTDNYLKKNIIWNTLGSFVYFFCQWILTLVVVRLSTDFVNAGNLSLAMSVTNIFYTIACLNVRTYLVSDFSKKIKDEEYIGLRVLTCVLGFLLCLFYISIFKYTVSQMICITAYMGLKICEAWTDLLHSFEQKNNRMDIGGKSLFYRGILSFVVFTVLLYITDNINLAIISMTAVCFIFIILYDHYHVKKFIDLKFKISKKILKISCLSFVPITLASVVSTLMGSLPRQVLEIMNGTEVLGIYASVSTPAVIVQVASSYIYNPFVLRLSINYEQRDIDRFFKLFTKINLLVVGLGVICIVGSIIFGEFGLKILYGEKISKYSSVLVPVIIYTSINATTWFLINIMVIIRKIKSLLIIHVISGVISSICMVPMIKKFSMNGVSYIMIMFSLICLVLMMIDILRSVNNIFKTQE